MDADRALAIAEELLSLPTAPHVEDLPVAHVVDFADERPALTRQVDAAGNVVVRYDGPGAEVERPLVLVAHLDHPGFVVDAVAGTEVSLTFRGGLGAAHARPGSPLQLFLAGAVAPVGEARLVTATERDGRLTGATAEVTTGDAVAGGFAMWGFPAFEVADGRITGRVCDDLVGAAAALAALDTVARERPERSSVWALLTRAEEVGFLGALAAIHLGTVPKAASVVSLECSKALPHARQGDGVIIRVGDRMSIFAPDLTQALRRAAEEGVDDDGQAIPHQRRLMDGGACEATAFCAAGYRASGLALPLGNYHNAADDGPAAGVAPEHVAVADYLAEVALLERLALDPAPLREAADQPPAWFATRTETALAELVDGRATAAGGNG